MRKRTRRHSVARFEGVIARPVIVQGKQIVMSDEQCNVVAASARAGLTVVSGGPGTGKTSIVVAIMRLMVRLGVDPSQIALTAPTGKAAYRMGECVGESLTRIERLDSGRPGAPRCASRARDDSSHARLLARFRALPPSSQQPAFGEGGDRRRRIDARRHLDGTTDERDSARRAADPARRCEPIAVGRRRFGVPRSRPVRRGRCWSARHGLDAARSESSDEEREQRRPIHFARGPVDQRRRYQIS